MQEVTIVQRLLTHYRVDFFDELHKALEKENVKLNLVYGTSNPSESLKKDEADVSWGTKIKNKRLALGRKELCWQPCIDFVKNSDLVIVEQANKNLINYWLLLNSVFSRQKIAFWGHGLNLQDSKKSLGNLFKKTYIGACDWWFAYTSKVKEFLTEHNFAEDRITVVQNAINTNEIIKWHNEISAEEMAGLRLHLNINSDNIGIYCGGIYPEKRMPFLIEAAELIKKDVPDFQLVILGSGPDVALLKGLIRDKPWVRYLGPKFGREKIMLFKISKVFLMPGLVGLAILDAFAAETPLITSDFPYHSPEIEYLENGQNGIMSANNTKNYAQEVSRVLNDETLLHHLKNGCKKASAKYTLETMVHNFKEGIVKCLDN